MVDAERTQEYPPPHPTWRFGPRRAHAVLWTVALSVVVGVVVVAGVVVAVLQLAPAIDRPDVVDDRQLAATIEGECALMSSTVAAIPVTGTAQRQSDAIRDQDRAVEIMVERIRDGNAATIRADRPVAQWLRDWERLVERREDLASALLRDPNASLVVPLDDDGDPLVERMDDVWPGDPRCVVPTALATADADALEG